MKPETGARPRTWVLWALFCLLLYGLHQAESRTSAAVRPAGLIRPGLALIPVGHDENATADSRLDIDSRLTRIPGRLEPGDTLEGLLKRLAVADSERRGTIAVLGRMLDLRRLPPGAGLVATRGAEGRLRALTLRTEPERFVRLRFDAEGGEPSGEIVRLPSRTRIDTAGGRVSGSVYQALAASPLAHELTLAFADIFQWDIDLFIDPRAGDRVRLVHETEILGEVPEDLPVFGNAASRSGEILRLGSILAASYEGRVVESVAYRVVNGDGLAAYYDADGRPLHKTFLKSPLSYRRISSRFSNARRHPITRKVVPHHGVDFAAAAGTPVVAAADGRVVAVGWAGALGRAVRVSHGSQYVTVYGHLQAAARGIRAGSEVRQGDTIGFVGSTGRATGPHLHYTLIERGRPIDPLGLSNPPAVGITPELWPRLEQAKLAWARELDSIPLPPAAVTFGTSAVTTGGPVNVDG